MNLADKDRMKSRAAFLCLLIALLAAPEEFIPVALAQSPGGEVVVAQNDGPGGFFRRLFNRRRQPQPQRAPFQLFPDFDAVAPPVIQPRRERKSRTAVAKPKEAAAVKKAENAKRALVLGDFMGNALAKGLTDAYRDNPNVVVIDASSGSSGLVRDDYFNWPAKVPEIVAEQKPDAILIMIGGNDRQTMQTAAGSLEFGSDAWRATYAARITALADALKATGKPVLWGGLVPVASAAMSGDYSSFNGIVREQTDAKGLQYIDMWNGFSDDDGKYVAFGPDVRGQSVQLRADDGLNFTRAGQRKLAYFVEQNLSDLFGGAVPTLAAVQPQNVKSANPLQALIGPMVPLDALETMGGENLSGAVLEGQRGGVATAIAARVSRNDARPPPAARADSYLWPVPPALRITPAAGTPLRGPQ
jgi:hypothetical protein